MEITQSNGLMWRNMDFVMISRVETLQQVPFRKFFSSAVPTPVQQIPVQVNRHRTPLLPPRSTATVHRCYSAHLPVTQAPRTWHAYLAAD